MMLQRVRKELFRWAPPVLFLGALLSGVYYFVLNPDELFEKAKKRKAKQFLDQAKEYMEEDRYSEAERSLTSLKDILDNYQLQESFEQKMMRSFQVHTARNIWENLLTKQFKKEERMVRDVFQSNVDKMLHHYDRALDQNYPRKKYREKLVRASDALWENDYRHESVTVLEQLVEAFPEESSFKKTLMKRYLLLEDPPADKALEKARQFEADAQTTGDNSFLDYLIVSHAQMLAKTKGASTARQYYRRKKQEREGEIQVHPSKRAKLHFQLGRRFLEAEDLNAADHHFSRAQELVKGLQGEDSRHLRWKVKYFQSVLQTERDQIEKAVTGFRLVEENAREQELLFAAGIQKTKIRLQQILQKTPAVSEQVSFLTDFEELLNSFSESVIGSNPYFQDLDRIYGWLKDVILAAGNEQVLKKVASVGGLLKQLFPDSGRPDWIEGLAHFLRGELLEKSYEHRTKRYRSARREKQSSIPYKVAYTESATGLFDAAKKLGPGHEKFVPLLKKAAIASNKAELPDLTEAILNYTDEVLRDPEMQVIRGEAYEQAGEITLAGRQYQKALESAESLVHLEQRFPGLQLGRMYIEAGRLDKAREVFRKNQEIFNRIGLTNYHRIWKENVVELFRTEVMLARQEEEEGREQHLAAARRIFKEEHPFLTSKNRQNSHDPGVLLRIYFYKGLLHEMKKQYGTAADAMQRALNYASREDPEKGGALIDLPGYQPILRKIYRKLPHLLTQQGATTEALTMYREALNSSVLTSLLDKTDIQLSMAKIRFNLGKVDVARSHLRTAGQFIQRLKKEEEYSNRVEELSNRFSRLRKTIFSE